MKRIRLRTSLVTAAFLIALGGAWFYFAPTQIGGSTRYVVTSGISMEPRFHTGDVAIVRPASQYKVGDITAYWSTLLHTVVLHRIYAIHGNRYVFKGDNNHFLDPRDPTRAQLLGKLWLHVPRVGKWLNWIHTPIGAAVLCAFLGTLFLVGFGEKRRRRRKRERKGAPGSLLPGMPLVSTSPDQGAGRHINFGTLLTASAVAVAVFVMLGAVAFTRPATRVTAATTPYTQQVNFGYSATARPGLIYPTGVVKTGDPIFLSLVKHFGLHIDYGFVSAAPHDIAGTEEILLQLTGQNGWSKSIVLTPTTRFTGDHTGTVVALDIPKIESLLDKVARITGTPAAAYSIAVEPQVHITGTIAGHPLNLSFEPALSVQLSGSQLSFGPATPTESAAPAGSPAAGGAAASLHTSRDGGVGTPGTASASITVLAVSPKVSLLRFLSVLGLLMSALATAFFYLRKRSEPFQETVHIQSKYGHMIVPIVGGDDLGWPPVDVPTIKALVQLAESGQRLILHNRSNDIDTYMVNEEGTVYRYQVKPSKVVWGEWSAPAADLGEAASEIARVAAEATPSAPTAP